MMKKNLFYFFLMGIAFVSCTKDDNGNERRVSINTISAKWNILDSNSSYASIEFTKDGNYIVVERTEKTDLRSASANSGGSLFKPNSSQTVNLRSSQSNLSPIHFGNYTIEGNNITLSGFGLIEAVNLTTKKFVFSFTLEATGEKYSYVAEKAAEPISSSNRTEMICRTWVLEKATDESGNDIEYLPEDEIIGSFLLFSKSGTYLVLYGGGEGGEAGLSEWKWANKEETEFYYSWDNWNDDWEYNIVKINQLTNDSLVFQEEDRIYYLSLRK